MLLVLIGHSSNAGLFSSNYVDFGILGKHGVYLFFVLSSYLLDRQIALNVMQNKADTRYWLNYLLRRFLRIYPLYLICLCVHFMMTKADISYALNMNLKDVLRHLLLMDGKIYLWSIPVEFKYYLLSPIIMYFFHRILKWRLALILPTIAALMWLSNYLYKYAYFHSGRISLTDYLPIFLIGTTLAVLELLWIKNSKKTSLYILEIIGIASLCYALTLNPYTYKLIWGIDKGRVFFEYKHIELGVLWGLVLLGSKYGAGVLNYIFTFTAIRLLGLCSFSVYLFHIPVLRFVKHTELSNALKMPLFILLTLAIALISYLFIEKPLSKIKLTSITNPKT